MTSTMSTAAAMADNLSPFTLPSLPFTKSSAKISVPVSPSGTVDATPKPGPAAVQPRQEVQLPITKTFSFDFSDFPSPNFNNPSPGLLQWVNELPTPAKRKNRPRVEPVHIQPAKHSLDNDDSLISSNDEHRDKRTRINSAASRHPAVESRRQKLLQSGKGMMRRASHAVQRVIAPNRYHRKQESLSLEGSTKCASDSLPGTPPFAVTGRPRMRFIFVGDRDCGKSCLLLRYYRDVFNLHYEPTQYELFNKKTEVDGREVEIELWDTCGDIKENQLQLLSYLAWDAVFLCFPINIMRSFNNAKTKWMGEIRQYCRGCPVFLLGLKTDLRMGSGLWAPLFPSFETRIPATEGSKAALELGCLKYFECSAKTGTSVTRIFEESVRIVLEEREITEEAERLRNLENKGPGIMSHLMCF
ncbi:ras family-domain-containing protein [Xylariaceae sp. FL0016]|nr:ras family-domain-containing protein [Xylariaceae sp. FL0016]